MREDRINGNDNGMNWNWYPIAGIQNHNPIAIEYSLDSPLKMWFTLPFMLVHIDQRNSTRVTGVRFYEYCESLNPTISWILTSSFNDIMLSWISYFQLYICSMPTIVNVITWSLDMNSVICLTDPTKDIDDSIILIIYCLLILLLFEPSTLVILSLNL